MRWGIWSFRWGRRAGPAISRRGAQAPRGIEEEEVAGWNRLRGSCPVDLRSELGLSASLRLCARILPSSRLDWPVWPWAYIALDANVYLLTMQGPPARAPALRPPFRIRAQKDQ